MAHPFYPSTRKAEVGHCEFKTSLNCIVTFRQTRILGDPAKKKGGGAHAKESCGPAQQVRGIVIETENQSSILRTHVVKENQFPEAISDHHMSVMVQTQMKSFKNLY